MNAAFTDSDYPGLYQAANAEAMLSQKLYFRCLSWFLFLLVLSSIANLIGGQSTISSLIAVGLLFGSLFFSGLIAWKRYDRTWYSARAVAESVKTIAWRYTMRAEPFDGTDQAARDQFLGVLQEILTENQDVTKELCDQSAGNDPISVKMKQIRLLPLGERLNFYRENRTKEQGAWYLRKAQMNKRSGINWFCGIMLLNGLAIGCAVLRVARSHWWTYIPTDVFVVAAVSAVSWLQAKRFTDLSTSYALTAHEISISRARAYSVQSEEDMSRFVSDTESAFSREHTQWAARRDARCRTNASVHTV